MQLADIGLRGAAAALLVLLGVLILRGYRRVPAGWYGGLLALGAAAYALGGAPSLAGSDAGWLQVLRLLGPGNLPLLWLFAWACFDDEFTVRWSHGLVWLATVALGAGCMVGHQMLLCRALPVVGLAFVALTIRHALIGRSADLIEERRRFRLLVVGGSALFAGVTVSSDFWPSGARGSGFGLVEAGALLGLAFSITLARLSFAPAEPALGAAEPVPPKPAPVAPPEPQDAALLDRLERLMTRERVYRREEFGIASLAEQMDIPEYRLRRLINQQLGHRNFTAFVNGYRLEEAKAALADPGQVEVPVLTIALDAGFQSIGPFNRAFKAATGLTPTEYRRQHG